MDDLVAFLKARLDEDQQAARACSGAPWEIEIPPMVHVSVKARRDNKWKWGRLGYVASVERDEDRAHIVRHDPARVLRDIDAKRKIVDEHQPGPGWDGRITPEHPHREPVCTTCADYDRNGDPTGDPYPCATLRQLAAVYSDHPSYRAEWRP